MRLPPGDRVALPWKPVLTLDRPGLKPDEAAGFRTADDAKVGRALSAVGHSGGVGKPRTGR